MTDTETPVHKLVYVTQRIAEGETQMECRFKGGQKFAAVTVDDILPVEVHDEIYMLLLRHAADNCPAGEAQLDRIVRA